MEGLEELVWLRNVFRQAGYRLTAGAARFQLAFQTVRTSHFFEIA